MRSILRLYEQDGVFERKSEKPVRVRVGARVFYGIEKKRPLKLAA
jgi:hypothetical protein